MPGADRLFQEAADKLKDTVRQGLSFEAAQIKVIGLDAIKREAGVEWRGMADRIRANSLAFIDRCVAPEDIVLPCGDGFLVIYHNAEDRDLDRVTTALQDSLNAFYLGEEGMARLTARAKAMQVTSGEMATLLAPRVRASVPDVAHPAIKFIPAWRPAKETVGVYCATPLIETANAVHSGYDPAYPSSGQHGQEDFGALDLEILRRCAEAAADSVRTGKRCLIAYSVHATTLQNRHRRTEFLTALAALSEETRGGMIGRIAEIAKGTPAASLSDWVHQLRSFTPRVALELHHEERVLSGFDAVGAWSFGCFLPPAQTPDRIAAHSASIHRWSRHGHNQGLKTFIFNIDDPVLLTAACASGIDLIAGDRMCPLVAAPSGMHTVSLNVVRKALSIETPRPPSNDARSPRAAGSLPSRGALPESRALLPG